MHHLLQTMWSPRDHGWGQEMEVKKDVRYVGGLTCIHEKHNMTNCKYTSAGWTGNRTYQVYVWSEPNVTLVVCLL